MKISSWPALVSCKLVGTRMVSILAPLISNSQDGVNLTPNIHNLPENHLINIKFHGIYTIPNK